MPFITRNDVIPVVMPCMNPANGLLIFLFVLLSSAISPAREAWRFLPCFGNDVRGIERHAAEGHFFLALPARESDRENYAEELCPKKG